MAQATKNAPMAALISRLRRAARVDSIGLEDGPDDLVIGTINDVTVDRLGRIYVLDMATTTVHVFSSKARPLLRIGRIGSGPSDFRFAVSMWTEPNDEIVVVDAILGAKYFRVSAANTASLVRIVRVGNPTGACGARGTITTLTPSSADTSKLVKVFGMDDREIRGFGSSYSSSSSLVRSDMSEGTIGCMSDGSVIAALSKLPFLIGYGPTGEKRWVLRFKDFVVPRILEEKDEKGRHAIGIDPNNVTSSYTHRVTPLDTRFALVQVGLNTPRSLRNRVLWDRLDSYLLDNTTGEAQFVDDKLPLIRSMQGDRLVGFDNYPFPRVLVMALPQ
ncbi:MAG: 6-bladed beta-propeller [Gemmatimonadaceae bacterium]|nr:6-bladed beta-propeller [Gemmatimonadaceae bacterium]